MKRLLIVSLMLGTLTGCMGQRMYPNTLPKNLNVVTKVDGGSTKVEVALDVHEVKSNCEIDFIGRLYPDNGVLPVGLATGKSLYLEFIFVSSDFLNSNIGALRQGSIMTLKEGGNYKADVYYKNGIYDVALFEVGKGGKERELPLRPLASCK